MRCEYDDPCPAIVELKHWAARAFDLEDSKEAPRTELGAAGVEQMGYGNGFLCSFCREKEMLPNEKSA